MATPIEVYLEIPEGVRISEDMVLVTAKCAAGHITHNLDVAKPFAYAGIIMLNNILCTFPDCAKPLTVLSKQTGLLQPPTSPDNPAS